MKHLYTNFRSLFATGALLTLASVNNLNAQCLPPPPPLTADTIICSGSSATLAAFGAGPNFNWFASSTGSLLSTGSMYTTPTLTNTTTYYVAQYSTTTTGSLALPAQTSPYTGNSRGYFFIAPTTMTITGVRVPTDAGTGNYNIAIVRLPSVPPIYPALTNTFTIAYLAQNQTGTSTVAVNIPVGYGDVIGVLGDRAGINSYASPAPFTNISFGSYTVTLNRMGMQFPLATTTPQDLWQEATGSISRVELYANLACLSSLAAATATVSTCTGIEELYGNDFRLSPNPSHDFINLKVSPELIGNGTIEIYDALGKIVLQEQINAAETRLNTSELNSGVYVYKVYNKKETIKVDKLIKE